MAEWQIPVWTCFIDYEKAFDYANRACIMKKLVEKRCGSRFTKAVAKMFESTTYIPVVNDKMGKEIKLKR